MKKLTITDKRILQLPDILINAGAIEYKKDFFAAIGIKKQNWYSIERENNQHFTVSQVLSIIKKFQVDGNWLMGLQNEHVFQKMQTNRKVYAKVTT